MKLFILLITSILLGFSMPITIQAQEIAEVENQKTSSNRYISFGFQNDLPYGTDYYFTNGIDIVAILPGLSNFPLAKLLPKPLSGSLNYYGIELVQNIYTPILLDKEEVIYSDRPYASELYLSFSRQSFNEISKSKNNHEILIGLIGKYSFGQKAQSEFHEAINNKVPAGWQNQVKTDPILNYNFKTEQSVRSTKFAELNYNWGFRAGTLYDDLSLGTSVRIGYFNPYYSGLGQVKKNSDEGLDAKRFQLYLYFNPEAKFVVYNSLLEGGLFNKKNIYELQPSDINPIVFRIKAGLVLQYGFLQIMAETNYLSPEIKGGRSHQWVNIAFRINF